MDATIKWLDTLEHCPKCDESGGCLNHRWVKDGHSDQHYFYYYWLHNPDQNGHRRSCYIGKVAMYLTKKVKVKRHPK